MNTIKKISAREILDSRGNPTIEVDLIVENNKGETFLGQAAVPSGASTGSHEAVELRDGDKARYNGKGVLLAIANVEGEIARRLIGRNYDQTSLDTELIALDGTSNKSHLGANALLGVSLAFAHATAKSEGKELFEIIGDVGSPTSRNPEVGLPTSPSFPLPMFNILNGGQHALGSTDIQEFMVVPVGAPTFAEAVRWGDEVYQALKKILEEKGLGTNVGDEGGFAPTITKNTDALDLIVEAIRQAGYTPGKQVSIALDVAATGLKKDEDNYEFKKGLPNSSENKQILTSTELIKSYEELVTKYPIISIEDGLSEDDWSGWQELTSRLGSKINIVGDDLFVTNPDRLHEGTDKKVANAIIIKPNQIGTLTETLTVIKIAQSAGYKIIVSHRSGETEDTTIADLAAGAHAEFIKSGAPARSERLAKYNRLLEIEKRLKA
ncbi:MAG TPA: phosphopyruvate hydratase [Candidatus Paceibacterota bacterium]|nr:phosphopyruvate hydratase [Candidatus Paceibacterota bacterium]